MGIDNLFGSISKIDLFKKQNGVTINLKNKIQCDYLYIDFNSIIYIVTQKMDSDLNYLLYAIIINKIDDRCKEIQKIWNIPSLKYEQYGKFLQTLQPKIVIPKISEYITQALEPLIDPKIKLLYISFDGIPNIGKMIEQKKRRYMDSILSEIKKTFNKNFASYRELYDRYKYTFDRSVITSSHPFMRSIYEHFKDFKFHKANVIINGPDVFGEGEKKIMEDIVINEKSGDYAIFSPDADLIVLAIILQSILAQKGVKSTFKILRYNQQQKSIDLINIANNLFEFAKTKLNKDIDIYEFYLDFSYIVTLFGNDFVPKIEAIDPDKDIETLLNKYFEFRNNGNTSIIYKKDDYMINYENLGKYLLLISKQEKYMIIDKYIKRNYLNYFNISDNFKIISEPILFKKIKIYIQLANNIFDYVDHLKKQNSNIDSVDLKMASKYIFEEFMKNIDDKYIDLMMSVERYFKNSNDTPSDIFEKIELIIEVLWRIKEYPTLKFIQKNEDIESDFHQKRLRGVFPHSKMEVTPYDIEVYMLENKLGKYKKMLNAIPTDIGYCNLKIVNNRYEFKYSKNMDNYYETFDIENKTKLTKNYIKALYWVFDFYYNKNDHIQNLQISTWFYKYYIAPTLSDICRFILKKDNEKYYKDILGHRVPHDKFMTPLEHLMYINPLQKIRDLVPKKYVDNKIIFPDLTKISNEIVNYRGKKYIDCRMAYFVNKCHLTGIKPLTFRVFKKALQSSG